ncbi:MAG TPA: hypothetical protein VJX67_13890 [Blastocatellia bacterium]|nr:hypothetical protein [Blastocatellia bacterium]
MPEGEEDEYVTFSVRLPKRLVARVEAFASADIRSRNGQIEHFLTGQCNLAEMEAAARERQIQSIDSSGSERKGEAA